MSLREIVNHWFSPRPTQTAAIYPSKNEPTPQSRDADTPTEEPTRQHLNRQLVSGITNFSFLLHRRLSLQRPSGNVVISPISISFALAMAANGARGQTRDSIAGVLGLENLERDNFNNCFSQILGALPTRSSKAQVCIANSLWIDDAAPVRNEFIRECKKFFSGEIFNVSFASANAAAHQQLGEQADWRKDPRYHRVNPPGRPITTSKCRLFPRRLGHLI